MVRVAVRLGGVQETLLLPLLARATEMHARQPILRDPKSLEIVEALDYDFRAFRLARRSRVGCLMRGIQFDAWVGEFIAANPTGTVIELGAGLNTRFERLDNGSIHWVDLDLPDSMALREQFFTATDRRKLVAASVLERDWFEIVRTMPGPYCFVSEAVLLYLPQIEVARLLTDLSMAFPGAMMAFDHAGRYLYETQHRHDALMNTQARFAWFLDSPEMITTFADGLMLMDVANMQVIGQRYHHRLPIGVKLMGLLMKLLTPRVSHSYTLCQLRLGSPTTATIPAAAIVQASNNSTLAVNP